MQKRSCGGRINRDGRSTGPTIVTSAAATRTTTTTVTAAAVIAALAANAVFAEDLTLPVNAAFMRWQRLRWTWRSWRIYTRTTVASTSTATAIANDRSKSGGRRIRGGERITGTNNTKSLAMLD